MRIQVALNLSSKSNSELLLEANSFTVNMTGNEYFASDEVKLQIGNTKTAITAFQAALNAPTSDTKTDAIRIARDVLNRELTSLKNKVEDIANKPTIPDSERVSIVHSAGMTVKNMKHSPQRVFKATNTEKSGVVLLQASGGANAHEWQYTTDTVNLTNRQAAETTTTARTEIADLKKATEYAFFHKAIIPGETTDWEGPVFLIVT